jgi:hypothetical protein
MREELQKGGDSDRCRAGSSLRDRQVPACRARACRRGTPLNAGSASRRVSGPRSAARQEGALAVRALRRERAARGARESTGRHLGHLEGERVHDRPAHVGTDQPRGQHALEHALTGAANSGDLPGGMWFVPACQPGKRRQRGEVLRKRWAASRPRKTRRMRPRS